MHDTLTPVSPMQVDYPNRSLSMRHARSSEDAAYDTNAWAQVALANLRAGEKLPFEGGMATVTGTSERQLRVVDAGGRSVTMAIDGIRFERLVRDLGGYLLAAQHGANGHGDALTALRRDPAFCSNGPDGQPRLRDVAPAATSTAAPETDRPKTRRPRP